MAREIALYIEANAEPQGVSATEQVSALIRRLLPGGECNVDRVAQLMGVDRRTVHRRLAAEGVSFTQLLDAIAARRRDVRQLINSDRPLGEVAIAGRLLQPLDLLALVPRRRSVCSRASTGAARISS